MVAPDPTGSQDRSTWLPATYNMSQNGTLRLALGALCVTRIARIRQDMDLIAYGHSVYGRALRSLQSDLYSDRTAYTLQTTSTCRIMSIYEVSTAG